MPCNLSKIKAYSDIRPEDSENGPHENTGSISSKISRKSLTFLKDKKSLGEHSTKDNNRSHSISGQTSITLRALYVYTIMNNSKIISQRSRNNPRVFFENR